MPSSPESDPKKRDKLVDRIVKVIENSPYAGVRKGDKSALVDEIFNKSTQPRVEAWIKKNEADKKGKKEPWKTGRGRI